MFKLASPSIDEVLGLAQLDRNDQAELGRVYSLYGQRLSQLGESQAAERQLRLGYQLLEYSLGHDDPHTRDASKRLSAHRERMNSRRLPDSERPEKTDAACTSSH